MIKRGILARHCCRYNSTILFTPNETKHIFDEEKLTREENYLAVPSKPDFSNIQKRFEHIINPEEVADLVTKLNTNDVLIASLSKNQCLYGDKSYVLKSIKNNGLTTPTRFPYATIMSSWKSLFNQQIKQLQDLEPKKADVMLKSTEYHRVYRDNKLTPRQFFEQSKAFENSRKLNSGKFQLSELHGLFTVEKASDVVLDCTETQTEFVQFVQFIKAHLLEFTFEGLKNLLTRVSAKSLALGGANGNTNSDSSCGESEVSDIFKVVHGHFPQLIQSLTGRTLDNLARVTADMDLELSQSILKELLDRGYCPEVDTIEAFLNRYLIQNLDKIESRDLFFLKSVLFHRAPSPILIEAVLASITNINELTKFIMLLKKFPNVLAEQQLVLYEKLEEFNITPLVKANFLRLLQQEKIEAKPELLEKISS